MLGSIEKRMNTVDLGLYIGFVEKYRKSLAISFNGHRAVFCHAISHCIYLQ